MSDRPLARLSVWQAAGIFLVLTFLFTWPQVIRMTSVPENVDSYFNLWRIAWIAHQIVADPAHLFDTNIYYPLRNTLAFSDAILLEGLIAAPFLWLGVPTVIAGNLLVLAGFFGSALGMFVLVRDLTGDGRAGILAGIVYAFAPFRFGHYMHLEMLWAQWMPLALWSLHRVLVSGRWRDGVLTGVFIGLQGLSSIYYVVFFVATLPLVAAALVIGRPVADWRRAVMPLMGGALIAGLMVAPYVRPYPAAAVVVGERSAGEALIYGAGPKHYLAATPDNVVYGSLTSPLGKHEKYLFPGFVTIALIAFALWPPIDRTRLAYALMLALAIDLSFGVRGLTFGWLREHLAAFRGLRVAARAAQIVLIPAAVLAGFGLTRLLRSGRGWSASRPTAIAVGACLLLSVEFITWPRSLVAIETRATPVYEWLRAQPPGVVAEVPLPVPPAELSQYSGHYDFLSTFHWKPMVNGYSGTFPDDYVRLLLRTRDFPSEAALAALRQVGVTYLIVHERFLGPERYDAVTAALDARVDLEGFGPFPEGQTRAAAYRWR